MRKGKLSCDCRPRHGQEFPHEFFATWMNAANDIMVSKKPQYAWTDGNNLYYSDDASQLIFNKETNAWEPTIHYTEWMVDASNIWHWNGQIYYTNTYVFSETYVFNGDVWEPTNSVSHNGYSNISGDNIWTDGTNIYCGSGLVLTDGKWVSKTWNGPTSLNEPFLGRYIWTDGTNTYYSNLADQYVLNGDTWEPKTWNYVGTFFYHEGPIGNQIWSHGGKIYCTFQGTQAVLDGDTWTSAPWEDDRGFDGGNGASVWTDGTNIYFSSSDQQYVLVEDHWQAKTWEGISSFSGDDIWYCNGNIYLNYYGDDYRCYILGENGWVRHQQFGKLNMVSENIWSDGTNIRYGVAHRHYIRNDDTGIWESVYSNASGIYGKYCWSDGTNIYYSDDTAQYILNKETGIWERKTWNGLTRYSAEGIWTDGTDMYCTAWIYDSSVQKYVIKQYILNKDTDTWEEKIWSGFAPNTSEYIWTDGTNTYYSNGTAHYTFNSDTWEPVNGRFPTTLYGYNVWTDGNNIYHGNTSILLSTSSKLYQRAGGKWIGPYAMTKGISNSKETHQ